MMGMTLDQDWSSAYIGLGSNLDDREHLLTEAIRLLDEHPLIRIEAQSLVYETEPVGYTDQPTFLNMVIRVHTALMPEALLEAMSAVEQRLGRTRDIHWGPRTVDLDLLLYGEEHIDLPHLIVPHPRMLERAFVLVPLQDILTLDLLPQGISLAAVLQNLEGKEGVKRWIKKL